MTAKGKIEREKRNKGDYRELEVKRWDNKNKRREMRLIEKKKREEKRRKEKKRDEMRWDEMRRKGEECFE